MQDNLKLLLPVALAASVFGGISGYAFHNPPASAATKCETKLGMEPGPTELALDTARDKLGGGSRFSWRRWPSITDF